MSRVFIDRFDSASLADKIAEALDWIQARNIIKPGSRVFIKPNLTWRLPTPGVTVTPVFIRALVENLLPLTPNITIGESEGGQACFQAEESFEHHGLYALERDFGIQVVNLSKGKQEKATTRVAGKTISVELPSLLLHEVDVFITLPVPKVHALTGVSLGFKNQWGCLGDKMRVTQHPRFDETIVAINKLVKPQLCIFDGSVFLDYTGPLMGEPVSMNLVIAGDDVGAASRVCCDVMRIDPMSISHHRMAAKENLFPDSLAAVEVNRQPSDFSERSFKLRRAPLNYLHLAAFKNVALNRLFYDSVAADSLHELLWFIRRNTFVRRFLYGKIGPGEANRGGRAV
jgi:uncharacterized protein (DUF362 family)